MASSGATGRRGARWAGAVRGAGGRRVARAMGASGASDRGSVGRLGLVRPGRGRLGSGGRVAADGAGAAAPAGRRRASASRRRASSPAAASAKKIPHWMPTFAATPWVVIPGLSNRRRIEQQRHPDPGGEHDRAVAAGELEGAPLAAREQQVEHGHGDEQDGGLDEREDLERVQVAALQRRRARGVDDRVLLVPRQEHRHEQRRRGGAREALLGRQGPPGAAQSCHAPQSRVALRRQGQVGLSSRGWHARPDGCALLREAVAAAGLSAPSRPSRR